MDVKEEDILGDRVGEHWYYAAKAAALRAYVADAPIRRIVDVGAGSGFFSKHLLSSTVAQEAICVDLGYRDDRDEHVSGKAVRYRRHIGPVEADLVLMMDVLEHVDADTALLSEYVELVPSGARFFISVPAFEFLWSEHDVFLEHKRRYTLAGLERAVAAAGMTIERSSYFYGAVFPLAAAQRLLSRSGGRSGSPRSQLKHHWPITNLILGRLCAIDLLFLRFNRVAGLSALCLARKP